LIILINNFLDSKNIKINDISQIYVNRGPGSFAGIRNSLSLTKAIHLTKKIDYFCFSFQDFKIESEIKYENIPILCDKFKVKKNLIKPIYIS
jgi:tRNA threonylcarbamoyladenosine biosynthesis protein TsaB